MKIDVSEIKSYRECPRKWGFSSRNYFHMRKRAPSPNLAFGTVFHEALHSLYIGGPAVLEKTLDNALNDLANDKSQQATMTAMLIGYTENVLISDLERYQILDIEHGFNFKILPDTKRGTIWENIEICGSIDMIAADNREMKIYGFEHKSCANFRPDYYNVMDEQPRLYYIALDYYIAEYNAKHGTNYTNGGIYINQVRKLQRKFEHSRGEPFAYTDKACQKFMESFMLSAAAIHSAQIQRDAEGKPVYEGAELPLPTPGFMKCQLCDYRDACAQFGYECPTAPEILNEYEEELVIRDTDHLEEKLERVVDE